MKKRTIMIFLGVFVVAAVSGVVTQVKTSRVEKELTDIHEYIKLIDSDNEIDWSKTNLFFWSDFVIHATGVGGTQNYDVTPVWEGFVLGVVDLGQGKLDRFPEDIWSGYHISPQGTCFYPGSREARYDDWKSINHLAVSFDRPYTIEEVMEVKELVAARWFWIDTYSKEMYFEEGYMPAPGIDNCAYGVSCDLEDLPVMCKEWVNRLNAYNQRTKTKSGKRMYGIKERMNGGEPVTLESIRIIGCEIRAYGYEAEKEQMKDNPMFHIVQGVNEK